jgi:hypothetical protein
MKHVIIHLGALVAMGLWADASPTEVRQWRTGSGHATQAKAISASVTEVKLELPTGRIVAIPLEKLVPEDREFVMQHFKPGAAPATTGVAAAVRSSDAVIQETGQNYEVGKISAPLESAPGSHYLIYVPKSLRQGRKAPLLHYNGSGGGKPQFIQRYISGCERFGWILVASVESHNKTYGPVNLRHAENNINLLRKNPLVDPKRVYFTGQSGGGAMSWWNADRLDGAGTLPVISYIPPEASVRGGHHFVLGGAKDWNRYHSGRAAAKFGKDAFYRAYPGGHDYPEDLSILDEGIGWLTGKYLASHKSDASLAGERLDYEAAMIDWIHELSSTDPGRAIHLSLFLTESYGISGRNGDVLQSIISPIARDPAKLRYAEGIREIHGFGVKEFAEVRMSGSPNGKNIEDQRKSVLRLAKRYAGTPFVEKTLIEMAEPTAKK